MSEKASMKSLEIRDFLMTKRASLKPEDVGITSKTRRRTPGLRREEVAELAGVGLTWYTWLEQGKPISVSESVVESLSRVLRMTNDEKKYFYQLTGQVLEKPIIALDEDSKRRLQNIIDSMKYCPSLIINQYWDVELWNNPADNLLGPYEKLKGKNRNIVYEMFLNKKYRKIFVSWEDYAKNLIAAFRMSCGEHIDDSRFMMMKSELCEKSMEFREWWDLHELDICSAKTKILEHEVVGRMKFEVTNFVPVGYDNFRMVIHFPIEDSMEKMKRLEQRH